MVVVISGIIKMDCDFCAWELDLRSEGTSISRGLQWEIFGDGGVDEGGLSFLENETKVRVTTMANRYHPELGVVFQWIGGRRGLEVGAGWLSTAICCWELAALLIVKVTDGGVGGLFGERSYKFNEFLTDRATWRFLNDFRVLFTIVIAAHYLNWDETVSSVLIL